MDYWVSTTYIYIYTQYITTIRAMLSTNKIRSKNPQPPIWELQRDLPCKVPTASHMSQTYVSGGKKWWETGGKIHGPGKTHRKSRGKNSDLGQHPFF